MEDQCTPLISSDELISCRGNCRNEKHCCCIQIYVSSKKPSCKYKIGDFEGIMVYEFVEDSDQHHRVCYCKGFKIYRFNFFGDEQCIERFHRSLIDEFNYGTKSCVFDLDNEEFTNKLFDLLCDIVICCIYMCEITHVNKLFDYNYFFETVKRNIKTYKNVRISCRQIIDFINETGDMFDTNLCVVQVETTDAMNLFEEHGNKIKKFIGDELIEKLKISETKFDVLLAKILDIINNKEFFLHWN